MDRWQFFVLYIIGLVLAYALGHLLGKQAYDMTMGPSNASVTMRKENDR